MFHLKIKAQQTSSNSAHHELHDELGKIHYLYWSPKCEGVCRTRWRKVLLSSGRLATQHCRLVGKSQVGCQLRSLHAEQLDPSAPPSWVNFIKERSFFVMTYCAITFVAYRTLVWDRDPTFSLVQRCFHCGWGVTLWEAAGGTLRQQAHLCREQDCQVSKHPGTHACKCFVLILAHRSGMYKVWLTARNSRYLSLMQWHQHTGFGI